MKTSEEHLFSNVLLLTPFCLFTEKGVVYVDSDNEAEDLDTLDSTCRGHGISLSSDPSNTTFQIVSTKIHNEGKHVVRGG